MKSSVKISRGQIANVFKEYETIALLTADQENQSSNRIYKVIDASADLNITFKSGETKKHAYYEYNETSNGSIDDYTLISAPYAYENKLAGIEAGAQVNVKTDWAESDPSSDKFLENKPAQINFNIYNQNSNDEVVVNNTTSTNIIAATTGATALPSYNLNDSFIGKLFGTFDNSNQASTVRFHFIIGNRTYSMAIDVGASSNILPVSIDYTINFPINREAHFSGVVRIGADSSVIDIQLPTSTITGLNYTLEAELELGELKSKSSYLHRNYN